MGERRQPQGRRVLSPPLLYSPEPESTCLLALHQSLDTTFCLFAFALTTLGTSLAEGLLCREGVSRRMMVKDKKITFDEPPVKYDLSKFEPLEVRLP